MRTFSNAIRIVWVLLVAAPCVHAQTVVAEDFAVDVAVQSAWTTTSAYVEAGDTVFVLARGTVGHGDDWRDWHGPTGVVGDLSTACANCPLPGYPTRALVARIGNEPSFYVGRFAAFVAQTDGVLYLGVNDDAPGNNLGTLRAFVWRRSDTPTAVDDERPVSPGNVLLYQNVPNPFNPFTTIHYSLPEPGRVILEIFDVNGRRVTTLASGRQPAGEATVVWKGADDRGDSVASGVYFYRLRFAGQSITRKMILLR
jgi:hypothetical protein